MERSSSLIPSTTDADALALTHDDRLFIALYLEIGQVAPAAMEAYHEPDPVKAGRIGNAALKRMPDVFALQMDHLGLTDAHLVAKIKAGMDAKRTKFATHQGEITDERETDDNQAQATYTRLAMELRGRTAKTNLAIEDSEARVGLVILPVREGMELPAQFTVESGDLENDGGVGNEAPGPVCTDLDTNASPTPEEGADTEKGPDGSDLDGWE